MSITVLGLWIALLQGAPPAASEHHPQVDRLSARIAAELVEPEAVPGYGAPARPSGDGVMITGARTAPSAGTDALRITLTANLVGAGPRLLLVDAGVGFRDPLGKVWVPVPGQHLVIQGAESSHVIRVLPVTPKQARPVPNMPLRVVALKDQALIALLREVRRIEQSAPTDLARYVKVEGDGPPTVDTAVVNRDAMLASWLVWSRTAGGALRATFPVRGLTLAVLALDPHGFSEGDAVEWLREHEGLRVQGATEAVTRAVPLIEGLLERVGLNPKGFSSAHADYHFNEGLRAMARGDAAAALTRFEAAARLDPKDREARYAVGVAAYRAGKFQDAADAFLVATGMQGATADAHYNRAAALYRLDDRLGAARSLRRTLTLAPNDEDAAAWLKLADPEGRTAPPPPPPPKKRGKRRRRTP